MRSEDDSLLFCVEKCSARDAPKNAADIETRCEYFPNSEAALERAKGMWLDPKRAFPVLRIWHKTGGWQVWKIIEIFDQYNPPE